MAVWGAMFRLIAVVFGFRQLAPARTRLGVAYPRKKTIVLRAYPRRIASLFVAISSAVIAQSHPITATIDASKTGAIAASAPTCWWAPVSSDHVLTMDAKALSYKAIHSQGFGEMYEK